MRKEFKIPKEKRNEFIKSIIAYFDKERDEEIGELAAGMLLDFFAEEIAPEYYNQGVLDAHAFMTDKAEDLLGLQR